MTAQVLRHQSLLFFVPTFENLIWTPDLGQVALP